MKHSNLVYGKYIMIVKYLDSDTIHGAVKNGM